ncbi:MAG: hypothetical protein ACLTMP_11720 [Eggerthella lenta]
MDGKVNAAIMLPKNGLGDMQSIMMPLRDALTAKGATFSGIKRSRSWRPRTARRAGCVSMQGQRIGARRGLEHRCRDSGSPAASRSCMSIRLIMSAWVLHRRLHGRGQRWARFGRSAGEQARLRRLPAACRRRPPGVCSPHGHRGCVAALARRRRERCGGRLFLGERGYWWTVFGKQPTESSQSRSVAEVVSRTQTDFSAQRLDELLRVWAFR